MSPQETADRVLKAVELLAPLARRAAVQFNEDRTVTINLAPFLMVTVTEEERQILAQGAGRIVVDGVELALELPATRPSKPAPKEPRQ